MNDNNIVQEALNEAVAQAQVAVQSRFPDLSTYKTLQDFNNITVNIAGNSHRFNSQAVSFSDMIEMAADLQSGMILEMDNENNTMKMTITREYALKSKKVKVDLACKLFNLQANDPNIDLETWMYLLEVVEASGFMSRLDALNKLK